MPEEGEGARRLARLRWACRRGMKELDLMLEGFLLQHGEAIAAGGWSQLEALLACEDDQLWAWLRGQQTSSNLELQALIAAIRG